MVNSTTQTIKFLCSYSGKIIPRPLDGKLRYVGGFTRVLAVDRSISFTELMVKLVEFCGFSVVLRCQLPNGDMETLISIKSEEELVFIIEEYDRRSPDSKIRAVLSTPKSLKSISPPQSINFSPTKFKSNHNAVDYGRYRSNSPPVGYPVDFYGNYSRSRCFPSQEREWCCRDPRCYKNFH
ncbi:RAF-like serine/threonine-protein kinase PRAF [Euphorbia lathyris]|uniref:RAF-like serine/threonine-protein kinase PRAF n=1 Tax=Euphorbia lathyris TaxID=212925 RepID=UPI003313C10A